MAEPGGVARSCLAFLGLAPFGVALNRDALARTIGGCACVVVGYRVARTSFY